MKEIQQLQRDETSMHVSQEAPAKTEKKLVGSVRMKPGHTLFEYDKSTDTIRKAIFKTVSLAFSATGRIEKKSVDIKSDNHYYAAALNYKNAIKKLKKLNVIKQDNNGTIFECIKQDV